jgi:hypothetical protein
MGSPVLGDHRRSRRPRVVRGRPPDHKIGSTSASALYALGIERPSRPGQVEFVWLDYDLTPDCMGLIGYRFVRLKWIFRMASMNRFAAGWEGLWDAWINGITYENPDLNLSLGS